MILMDLSTAYDCLPHDLLIAKLGAYGVGIDSLKLIYSYLTDRKQRVKIGNSFSTWKSLSKGVPQGSVLGPLLFNIVINDFFYIIEHSQVCNCADVNTIYACSETLAEVSISIDNDMRGGMNCYKLNEMAAPGVTIDSKRRCNEHIKTICQKTSKKVKAFSTIARELEPRKASLLYNSFILKNFNYYPLIWMFCGKLQTMKLLRFISVL